MQWVGLLILFAPSIFAALPAGFLGIWQGVPTTTPLGPLNEPFNFTVALLNEQGTEWLMSDSFASTSSYIPDSEQQFWVYQGVGVVYCGIVRNFFGVDGPIVTYWTQNIVSDNKLQWCWLGCNNSTWTLSLSADGQSLTSQVYIYNPVQHISVTFKRIAEAPKLKYLPPPCNLTESKASPEPMLFGGRKGAKSLCPYQTKSLVSKDSPIKPKSSAYQFCYILNPTVNFSLSWTYSPSASSDGGSLSVLLKAPAASTSYVALGFMPEFPGMIDADIALGYLDSKGNQCARSLYADQYVGTPIENKLLTLNFTSVSYENGYVNFAFTRSINSGNHNVSSPQPPDLSNTFTIMWAIGYGAADCTSPPAYHGPSTRGVRAIDWAVPDAIFGDFMKC